MGGVPISLYKKSSLENCIPPSLEIFDDQWRGIICKGNTGVTSEFGVVGVGWGMSLRKSLRGGGFLNHFTSLG